MLEAEGWLNRHYKPTVPPQVTYSITARVLELDGVMTELDRSRRSGTAKARRRREAGPIPAVETRIGGSLLPKWATLCAISSLRTTTRSCRSRRLASSASSRGRACSALCRQECSRGFVRRRIGGPAAHGPLPRVLLRHAFRCRRQGGSIAASRKCASSARCDDLAVLEKSTRNKTGNIMQASSKFAQRRMHETYGWTPGLQLRKRLVDMAIGRSR